MAELVGEAVRSDRLTWAPPRVTDRDPRSVGIHIYREASELIINVLSHPRASASWCHVPECVDECMRASFDSGVSGGCLAEWACADSRERPPVRFDHGCRSQISLNREAAGTVSHARITAVTSMIKDGSGKVPGLLAVLALVPDPRRPRGRRYQLTFVLAVATGDRSCATYDDSVLRSLLPK
jgi:hypothetical protein